MIYYQYVPDATPPNPKKKTWVCKNCHTVIMAVSQPSLTGCPTVAKNHKWYSLGMVGIRPKVFVCRVCGLRATSSISPTGTSGGTCQGGKNHYF